MDNIFNFCDTLGPAKIIHIYEPSAELKAILVVDNISRGPAIGGLRMATDVSTEECVRLARAMTLKNAAANIPHGGAKAVLFGDPKMDPDKKQRMIRALACSLRTEETYIFGPDMGTDETSMAWVRDEIGRAVGLPREIGGIPLDEIGATGWGISQVVDVALRYTNFTLDGARIVVQGFGSVGKHAARFLTDQGAILVGAADSCNTIYAPKGLNVNSLLDIKKRGGSLSEYPDAKLLDRDAVVDIDCDIWIPAARPDVINANNVHRLKTKLVVQGANIPVTHEAENILHRKGILVIPDFIANAGGVICAAMEYAGSTQTAALDTIKEKLRENTKTVIETSRNSNITPRQAANDLALAHVKKAMNYRRWSLFSSGPEFL